MKFEGDIFEVIVELDGRKECRRIRSLLEKQVMLGDAATTSTSKKRYYSRYFSDEVSAKDYRLLLKLIAPPKIKISIKGLGVDKWRDKWKKEFRPFKLNDKFIVVPKWKRDKIVKKHGIAIFIDTCLAFGTGLHETTKFVAEMITSLEGKFESFLDIGTGTGILTIIADKCGANDLTAVDLTDDVLKVTRGNLDDNCVRKAKLIKGDMARISFRKEYDLVAANLTTEDLIGLKSRIISVVRKGGMLAVSGISLKKSRYFIERFRDPRLNKVKSLKGKEWAAFLFKRLA
ncbi:MAG: 50S ribosomal protein L11 methyltransferase [Candidatus Omnitrophica bacterium]|nr:50S ribosomal protein L11 methyltransferase [Candidatus Omnitrophota bacterium]